MIWTTTLAAALLLAAGTGQSQEEVLPQTEEERRAEVFDESVDAEPEERPATEHQYDPQTEYDEPYTKRELNRTPIEDEYDRRQNIDERSSAGPGERQPPTGLDKASTATLPGKTIVTSRGEEVGTVEQVGYSRQHQERVAIVDVGGFLGAGGKMIAIPVSELGLDGEQGSVTTSMDRMALETAPEFDPSQLVTAEKARSPQLQE